MDQIEYRTIGACLRPPRVAVAYRTRSDWVHSARQVVASLSRVWGGAGAVILPISEGGAVAEDLLPLLRAYDPDHVAVHVMTAADLAVEDPGVVGRLVEGFAYPGESRDETWARVSKEPIRDQAWAILAEQVDGWCSPLKGLQQEARWFRQPQVNVVHREGEPGADLSLLPAESGETVYALNLAGIDPLIALMVESRVGAPPRNAPSGLNVLELPVLDEDLPALIGLAISGRVDEGWDLHNRVLMAIGAAATADPPPALTGDEYLAGTPFSRTRRWLTKVRTTQPPPTVCVIGDTAEDHALAMLCDRTFHHGAWIPLKLLSDEDQAGRAARRAIRRLRWLNGAGDAPVLVVSASQSTDVLAELVEDLEGSQVVEVNGAPTREQNLRAALAGGLAEQPGRSLLADERSFHVRRTVPIRQMAGELSLLTPVSLPIATAVEQLGKDMVWFIDVWVSGHQLPARTGIPSSALLEAPAGSFPEAVVRASRYGLSFSSRNMGFVPAGSTLEGRLAHPVLRLPSAEQIFAELAAKHGGTVQRSPAGRRAANAVELWGSLAAITTDLAGDVRRLLDAFIPPPVAAKTGHYGAGYAIRGDGYLTLRHASVLRKALSWVFGSYQRVAQEIGIVKKD